VNSRFRSGFLTLTNLAPDEAGEYLLGSVSYGLPLTPTTSAVVGAPLALLPAGGTTYTTWLSRGPFVSGQLGSLSYRHNDEILFGSITLSEADFLERPGCSVLQQATQAAYTAVFQVLAETGFPYLVRCWNYLPRINFDGGGLERYRQFNIGRQDAFIAASQAWLSGSPSACALGTMTGNVVLYFLASRRAPTAIENPRQISAYRYPEDYGPRSPTFSRASLLSLPGQEVLFISGTASIVGHESLHVGDVVAQTEETLRNIAAVLDQANAKSALGRFSCQELALKVFVRNPQDQAAVERVLSEVLGNGLDVIYLQADVCRAELLVEIEAFGFSEGIRA
jgi:chorismate lyase / 3-hydroxybenzoate synthase